MLRNIFLITIITTLVSSTYLQAKEINEIVYQEYDTLVTKQEIKDSVIVKKNLFQKIKAYFDESNVVKEEKAFDVSFIGGPHFSSDTKLGLGLVASGLYRIDKEDKSISPSNISLYGDITTKGFYMIGIRGNTIFPKENYRIDLTTFFASQPTQYWGIGYENGKQDDYTEYTSNEIYLKLDLLKKIVPNTYLGVIGEFVNRNASKFDDIDYILGEKRVSSYGGGGLSLSYDTRDFIPNPYKGIYTKLEYIIYPHFIGNRNTMTKTEALFRAYQQVWTGGVIAFDLQGTFQGGNVPWNMMTLAGGSRIMRGYYEGRYRDRMMVATQVELRQHVWRRNGVVLWAGAGNLFHDFDQFKIKETLPSFGIGYRWEFKNRVNVRLDYGIGKGESGFYFNINEAF